MRSSVLSVAALPLATNALGLVNDVVNGVVKPLVDGIAKPLNEVKPLVMGVPKPINDVKEAVKQTVKHLDENKFFEGPGIAKFPIAVNKEALDKHMRRQAEAGLSNRKTGFFYTIDIQIGSPPQTVAVNFDTGSSELWVNPNCAKSSDEAYCKTFGAFGKSSSWTGMGTNATLKYGRGHADIEYGYDYVQIGSSKLNQQVFGVAQDSEFATTGIMGVGPNLAGWSSPYPYVLDNMFTQKFINSRAFSLDLRHVSSDRGAAIFGGIDTKKFKGPLVKKDIIPASASPDGKVRYWASCDGITVNKEDGSKVDVLTAPQAFLFDSGYTVSALPTEAFNKLLTAFPSAKKDETGQYNVDCAVVNATGSLDFKFGEATISVSYNDFIWQQPEYNTCVLGAIPDDKMPVLGDTFLRAAYVVYDWDNRALHFAASDDCGTNLVAIGSGPNAVDVKEGDCGKPEPTSTSSSLLPTLTPSLGFPQLNATATKGPFSSGVFATGAVTTGAPAKNATTYTSAVTSTKVHTITSCAPTVTNCPVGKVTTEVVTEYTTWCPEEGKPKPTSTSTSTSAYTKPPCSEVTLTFVIPKTYYCTKGQSGCTEGQEIVTSHPATIKPITPVATPTAIPGCNDCHPKQPTTPVQTPSAPAGVVPVPVNPKPVETSKPAPAPSTPVAPAQPPVTPAPKPVHPVEPSTMASVKPSGTGAPVPSQPPIAAGAAGLYVPGLAAMVAALVAAM